MAVSIIIKDVDDVFERVHVAINLLLYCESLLLWPGNSVALNAIENVWRLIVEC